VRRRQPPPLLVRALASTAPPSRRRPRRRRIVELVGDPLLLAVVGLLVAVGLAAVYAATRDSLTLQGQSGSRYLLRDALNAGVAPPRRRRCVHGRSPASWAVGPRSAGIRRARPTWALTPLGATVNGAKAWYSFGPVQVEPSQLAVIVVIVFVVARLGHAVPAPAAAPSSGQPTRRRLRATEVAFCVLPTALTAGLILADPALGMAVVLVAVLAGLLILAGMRGWVLGLAGLLAGAAAIASWQREWFSPISSIGSPRSCTHSWQTAPATRSCSR